MLTKKDFERFAEYIANLNDSAKMFKKGGVLNRSLVQNAEACYQMVVRLNDNPNFDEERFKKACGF